VREGQLGRLSIALAAARLGTHSWQPFEGELGRVHREAQWVAQTDGTRREAGAQRPRQGRNAGPGIGW